MSEYQVGGSLNVNAATYVTRSADHQLYQGLLQGEFCYVFNCRQMGKSSLRVRAKNRLEQQGYACVSIDMTNIGSQAITPLQWYKSIASEIWRGLGLIGQVSLKQWWSEHSELSPLQHLNLFITEIVLPQITAAKIFIFIDEIDSVLSLDFATDDFFALIRYFYNARAEKPEFERLCFALFGVATPSELIRDSSRTPFNIGRAIELTGFAHKEAQPLIEGLNERFSHPELVLQEIVKWTGGQPFLTQKLCQLAVEEAVKMAENPCSGSEAHWVSRLTYRKIIHNWESQDEPEHLKTIRDRLLRDEQTVSRLLGLVEQILHYGSIAADESFEQRQLLLTNLVIQRDGQLKIRNPIYQQIFGLDWIHRKSDQLCPYRREVKFWLASQGRDTSRLLRGRALQDALVWAKDHNLSQQEYQFLNASQDQDQAEVLQKLELKRLTEVESRLLQEQKLAKTQRFLLITVGAALAVASVLGLTAFNNFQQAQRNEVIAEKNKLLAHSSSAQSLFSSQQYFASLVEALRAKRDLAKLATIDGTTKLGIDAVLQQAAYNVVEKNTFTGHQDIVNSVSYSQNGEFIASASSDNTIKIWQRDGKLRSTLKGHRDAVIDVAFNPRANILASAGEDHTVRLWSLQGKLKNTLSGHRGRVHRVVFSPKGDLIASASEDRTVRIWNLRGGMVNVLAGHQKEVLAVAFAPNGQTIATGDRAGVIRLWNLDGEVIGMFQGHRLTVRGLDFSPDGKQLVSGGDDKVAKIWNLNGNLIQVLSGYSAPVAGVKFSPSGWLIGTSSWDQSVKIWHVDGTLHSDLSGHQGRVWHLSWSPDGSEIATAGWDNLVKLWQIDRPLVKTFYGHQASVLSVAFQPQGNLIASSSDDHTVKLWHLDGTLAANFTEHDGETYKVAFSGDGEILASAGLDRTVKLWNKRGQVISSTVEHNAPIFDVVFLPNSYNFMSAGSDKTIKFWHLKPAGTRAIAASEKTIFAHQAKITDIAISKDGKSFASVSHDRFLKLWHVAQGLLQTVVADNTGLATVAISPDNQLVATGGKEKKIKLWDWQGRLIRTFHGHQAVILDLEFSPDGTKIASASADNTIKIWDNRGKLLTTLQGHHGRVWNIAFSPDGQKLISGAEDGLIKLWELEAILKLEPYDYGCKWIKDFLQTNIKMQESNERVCS